MFVVREVLDGLASRLAAHRITPTELSRLQVILESMKEAIETDRREQVVIANMRFHDVIYSVAGNDMLERIARDLREFVRRFTTLPFASPERVEDVLREHMAIYEGLRNHDPEAAELASHATPGRRAGIPRAPAAAELGPTPCADPAGQPAPEGPRPRT